MIDVIFSASLIQDQPVTGWIIVAIGVIFLFFGTFVYYSAIRLFGTLIGGIVGILLCYHLTFGSATETSLLVVLYVLSAVIGALIGGTLAIVFHHVVFFIGGAIICLILFKMFAQKLITPEEFKALSWNRFMELLKPTQEIEWVVLILGGVIYMASAHLLLVVTMALVGSFMIAYAFDIYILFPVLAAFGGAIQHMISRRKRVQVVQKKVVTK